MKIFFLYFIFIFSIISCNEAEKKVIVEQQIDEITFNARKLPKKVDLAPNAIPILNNWIEYKALNSAIDALYKAENEEDLRLVLDQIIEAQKQLKAAKYPEEFNKPHIKSRLTVVKTFALKAKAAIEYNTDILEPATEMITAFNNLRNQFSVMINNTLDTNLILNK